MISIVAAALVAATQAPVTQAPTPPPPVAAPAPAAAPVPPVVFAVPPIPATDPARLAAARPVIARLWPAGTYGRIMRTMMGPFMQATIARTFNKTPGDLLAGFPLPGMKPGSPDSKETIGQMAAKEDLYVEQRITLTLTAVGDAMAPILDAQEPEIREALAHAYARRYTIAQLAEIDRFLATPTGAAYAADATTLMLSPDMAEAMQSFTPRMVKAMPDIIARVTAATKDLPPVPKGKGAPPPHIDAPKKP